MPGYPAWREVKLKDWGVGCRTQVRFQGGALGGVGV